MIAHFSGALYNIAEHPCLYLHSVIRRGYLLRRFYRANVRVCSNARVKEITDQGLLLEKAGITFLLDADTVIVSVGGRSRKGLAEALKGKVGELYAVGDCDQVGNAMKAIESAYDTAVKI